MSLTKNQEKKLAHLKASLPLTAEELKCWELTETDYGTVWLKAEWGRKGDEGTLAEVICRESWFIAVTETGKATAHACPNWFSGYSKTSRMRRVFRDSDAHAR